MKHAVRQRDYGGTLLEVLVSLLIVTMVASSMVEIASQRRRALAEGRRSEAGLVLAIQWRTANKDGEEWTQGQEGSFPESKNRWALEGVTTNASGAGLQLDADWQRLTVFLNPDDPGDQASFLFRLDPIVLSLSQSGVISP